MKNKVVFIQPPISLEERYGFLGPVGTDTPPLGLCYLAAITRQAGYPTAIIDAAAEALSYEEVAERACQAGARYMCITATVSTIDKAMHLSTVLKQVEPESVIILGGPQITARPDEVMRACADVDIGIYGEGEHTLCELLEALETGADLSPIPGLIIRHDAAIVHTPPRPFIDDLDTLPLPAWEELPQPLAHYYKPAVFSTRKWPAFSLITSRGCYAQCIFCDRAVFGNRCRAHSADYVLDMIDDLYHRFGIQEFAIADDLFVVFTDRLRQLSQEIIDRKLAISWSCNARIGHCDAELLALMKKSGCWQIAYGLESGSDDILRIIKKGQTVEAARNEIALVRRCGIRVKGFFMIGAPGETEDTLKATESFIRSVGIDDFQLTYFTPLPGSEIYDRADEYGTFDRKNASINYWRLCFVPQGLTSETLVFWYKRLYRRFYFRPRTVWSYMSAVRSLHHLFFLARAAFYLAKMIILPSPRTRL